MLNTALKRYLVSQPALAERFANTHTVAILDPVYFFITNALFIRLTWYSSNGDKLECITCAK